MPLCPSETAAIKNGEAAAAVDESGPFINRLLIESRWINMLFVDGGWWWMVGADAQMRTRG